MTSAILNSLTHNRCSGRQLAGLVLLVMLVHLVIGGIILPYREAQAVLDFIGGPSNIINNVWNAIKAGMDKVAAQYQAAGTWLGAFMEENSWLKTVADKAAKFAWDRLRRMLLNMLVNDIVKWIQGGGEPRFVTDWQSFLRTAADRAAGQFISQDLKAGVLCGPFAAQLRIALARVPTFEEEATCTLSQISANFENFFSNFSNGGWKGWLAVSEPQNNIFGADLLALDRKYDLMAKAKEAAQNEALAGGGFQDDKVCVQRKCGNNPVENYTGSSGWKPDELDMGGGASCSCFKWQSITPGQTIGDSLSQAVGIDIPWLISAKEFSEYAGAIVDAVINRAMREGIATLTSSGEGTSADQRGAGIDSPASISVDLSLYDEAMSNRANLTSLIPQQKLLKENLNKSLAEYQKNLDILNQIKASQENSIQLLQQSTAAGCSLPGGSSVGSETIAIQSDCATVCPCQTVTTKTQPFTISGMGSGVLRQIITTRYATSYNQSSFSSTCTTLTYSASESSVINSTLTSTSKIAETQIKMQAIREKIAQVDSAINYSTAYQQTTQDYLDTYDAFTLNNLGTQAGVDAAAAAMESDRPNAIDSNQTVLGIDSESFEDFSRETMRKSQEAVQAFGDIEIERGVSMDCAYQTSGNVHKDLCNAQAKENEIKNNYDYCLSTRGGGGN